jgi:hypothetical protein
MDWIYNGTVFTEEMVDDNVGFVYIIYNLTKNKQYIGKKLFTKSKTYQKNKKKKKTRVASDWMTYTGSNEQLNEDIKNGDSIQKEILHLCKSKGWCSYLESKEILVRDCLILENYYNYWISCKIRRTHLK